MFTTTRRDFLKTSALGAAAATAGISISALSSDAFASTSLTGNANATNADLLRALGERIGFDAATRVAPNGEAVSLMYFDYAGTSVDALRDGITRGLSWQCGSNVAVNEIDVPYGALLGVAIVRNLETAVETRVEIDASMLSHLALIEATSPTAGIAKTSLMTADASNFFHVADVV